MWAYLYQKSVTIDQQKDRVVKGYRLITTEPVDTQQAIRLKVWVIRAQHYGQDARPPVLTTTKGIDRVVSRRVASGVLYAQDDRSTYLAGMQWADGYDARALGWALDHIDNRLRGAKHHA
jgi:hypothetical protein